VVKLLVSAQAISAEAAVRDTLAAVKRFKGGTPQSDDTTVLALQFPADPGRESMAVLHITINNDLNQIATVIAKFGEFATEHELPPAMTQKMSIAFDDLLNNVVSYAFPDEGEHEIEIRAGLVRAQLTVTISDDGIPFNPLSIQAPDTSVSLEDREVGGLGIHLVRGMVDDISYQRRINKNVLSVVMYINYYSIEY